MAIREMKIPAATMVRGGHVNEARTPRGEESNVVNGIRMLVQKDAGEGWIKSLIERACL